MGSIPDVVRKMKAKRVFFKGKEVVAAWGPKKGDQDQRKHMKVGAWGGTEKN
jgi:hypothetical protein